MSQECENPVIRDVLNFFLENNHRQFRPLFLSVISAYNSKKITEKSAEDFFKTARNFYFAYGVVCGGKSNTIEDKVYEFARKNENDDATQAIQELKDKLKSYYPDYDSFEAHFLLMGWSHNVKSYKTPSKKKEVQHILRGIEESYLSDTVELSIREFTIEHIANDDGTESHCTIGNLLMLAQPLNGNASNKELVEKIPHYSQSRFVSTKNYVKRYGHLSSWRMRSLKICISSRNWTT